MTVNCKHCENPFGELKDKELHLDYKTMSKIIHDHNENCSRVKCRNCSHYSVIRFNGGIINKVNTSRKVNCKVCDNPFGEIRETELHLDYNRLSSIIYDYSNSCSRVKCRKCSHYSVIKFDKVLLNEIDYKKTGTNYLG